MTIVATAVRERAVYLIKLVLSEALYATGLLWLVRCLRHRHRAVVLTYHRVLPDALRVKSWSHPGIIVSERSFEMHLATLTRWFHPVSPQDFAATFLGGRTLPPYGCVVTFDDGWVDTAVVAWPLLQRYQVPAIVFLPSALIGAGGSFWQEDLGAALAAVADRASRDPVFAARARSVMHDLGLDVPMSSSRGGDRQAVIAAVSRAKAAGQDVALSALRQTRALLDAPPDHDVDRLMTWPEATAIADAGFEVGGHGAHHVVLTAVGADVMVQDVNECASRMRQQFGRTVQLFAYPNGNWSVPVAEAVHQVGFEVAFTTERGHVLAGDLPLQLKRINVHEGVCRRKSMFLTRVMGLL